MGKNFYFILGIDRNSSPTDINRAYRLLSLKYHPDRKKDEESRKRFLAIAEAYDVLSDPKRRGIFDQFGEEGLTLGVPMNEEDGFSGAYTFHGDPNKVFRDFFGGDNPFSELFDFGITGDLREAPEFGGLMGRARPKQDPDQESPLLLTLEEVYRGCTKKAKVNRMTLNEDRRTSTVREKILTIHVPPGTQEGTKFRFQKEGDQKVNNIPADLVFVATDKPHSRFTREGADLHYCHTVPLYEALTGVWIEIHTLDDRFITVPVTDIIRPGFQKIVPDEGMPLPENPNEKGNLVITFEVEFPTKLHQHQKESLRHILQR